MHSDLLERCAVARECITVPEFPSASIRVMVDRAADIAPRRRILVASILVAFLAVGIAAAAAVYQRHLTPPIYKVREGTHIHFNRSDTMVLNASSVSVGPIPSETQIRSAAARLNFTAILPTGLPIGTNPIAMFTSGNDVLAISYDLPNTGRGSHHTMWIVLSNAKTLSDSTFPRRRRNVTVTPRYPSVARWRIGSEEVIVSSNGLTSSQAAAIRTAMQREAKH